MDNVVPISRGRKTRGSDSNAEAEAQDRRDRAQEMFYQALQFKGKKREQLLKEVLEVSEDVADAYTCMADGCKAKKKRVDLYKKALAVSERLLGKDWQSKHEGLGWKVFETRPPMRAMFGLALCLQEQEKLVEAIELFRALMVLNPDDNQGVRYPLAEAFYKAHCDEEFEKLIAANKSDPSAALLYTNALYLYRKLGATDIANKALLKAFKSNVFVPIFISEVWECPDEAPDRIVFGDESEAASFMVDYGDLWYELPRACNWMAQVLEGPLRNTFADQEMVDEMIYSLDLDIEAMAELVKAKLEAEDAKKARKGSPTR